MNGRDFQLAAFFRTYKSAQLDLVFAQEIVTSTTAGCEMTMRNVPEMTCLEFETVEFYGILFLIQLPIVGKFNTKHWIIVKFNYRFDSELLRNFHFVSTVGEFM